MKYRLLACLTFIIAVALSSNAVAENVLRFNPFQQSDMEEENLNAGTKSNSPLKLRGTVVDGEDSMANIDGKFYRLDEKVSGYRVIDIQSGKVTLHRGFIETVLTLNDDKKIR